MNLSGITYTEASTFWGIPILIRKEIPNIWSILGVAWLYRSEHRAVLSGEAFQKSGHPYRLSVKELNLSYMRQNEEWENGKRAMDILFPGIGENSGSSQRDKSD